MRIHVLVLSLLTCPFFLVAQDFELGITAGAALYEGELAPLEIGDYFQTFRPAVGLFGRYHFSRSIAVRSDLRYATIYGNDEIAGRNRGFNFRTQLVELSLSGEWTLFRLRLGPGLYAAPYAQFGGGLLYFNPQGERDNTYYDLAPLGTEGQGLPGNPGVYSQFTYVLFGGGGAKLEINDRWTIGIEGALRYTGTDYLDDVSTNPITYREVLDGNGSLAAHFSRPNFNLDSDDPDATYIRGGQAQDYLFMAVITVSTKLGGGGGFRGGGRRGQLGCPTNF